MEHDVHSSNQLLSICNGPPRISFVLKSGSSLLEWRRADRPVPHRDRRDGELRLTLVGFLDKAHGGLWSMINPQINLAARRPHALGVLSQLFSAACLIFSRTARIEFVLQAEGN
jgi:hypothetical protein